MRHACEAGTRRNIIVIEDDRTTARILEIHLVHLGYHVSHIFSSPTTALAEIRGESPDLIIMGISFPGDLDGIEAARIITAELEVPVVFLTASMDQETFKRAMQIQPSGYITKPPDKLKLQEVLTGTFVKHSDGSAPTNGGSGEVIILDGPVARNYEILN